MHHVNQPLVSVQFCAVKYTQIIVQQLPPSISRTFTSCKVQTLSLLNSKSSLSPPCQSLAATFYFLSLNFTTLGVSSEWNHVIFVFCDRFILLSKISLRFLHVSSSYFLKNKK